MKPLLLFLILLLSIQCYSQTGKYSKKELKEIVRLQQKQINDLLLKNDELSKLTARFHIVEQEKFNFLAEKNELDKIVKEKDNEILTKNREREFLLNSIKEYKKEIEKMNTTIVVQNNSVSKSFVLPNTRKSYSSGSYTDSYKEKSRRYITGPRGGCYYINGNGNKTYVDRSLCH
jgi:hypothetical protein